MKTLEKRKLKGAWRLPLDWVGRGQNSAHCAGPCGWERANQAQFGDGQRGLPFQACVCVRPTRGDSVQGERGATREGTGYWQGVLPSCLCP